MHVKWLQNAEITFPWTMQFLENFVFEGKFEIFFLTQDKQELIAKYVQL